MLAAAEVGVRWRRLAGFLLVGLVMHLVLVRVYTRLMVEHKAIRSDRAFLFRAPDHVSVLVCGDSHPRTAIDPNRLGEGVVNYAIGGEHYLKTWYRMRAALERTDRTIDTLLLPLEVNSFSSWHAWNFAPEYVWGRYVDFLEIGRVRGDPWPYATRQLKASLFPYAGELRTLAQLRSGRFGFGEELPTGSFTELSRSEQRQAARDQAITHFRGQEVVDPGLKWAFDQLVGWAHQHDVRLVLVAFPVTWDYWTFAQRSGAPEQVQQQVVDPLLASDPEVIRLDYHGLFFGQNDLFSDPHHLNPEGRLRFTRQLRQDLIARGVLDPAVPAAEGEAPEDPVEEP